MEDRGYKTNRSKRVESQTSLSVSSIQSFAATKSVSPTMSTKMIIATILVFAFAALIASGKDSPNNLICSFSLILTY